MRNVILRNNNNIRIEKKSGDIIIVLDFIIIYRELNYNSYYMNICFFVFKCFNNEIMEL